MPLHVAVSVMSRDRVGIIADVSGPIAALDGNIDAISQTVLRGYFALILNVDFAADVPLDRIREAIEAAGRQGELAVVVRERDPAAATESVVAGGGTFVLTMIMTEDHPGIVSRVTAYLAGRGINVLDFYAYRDGGQFVVLGLVRIPAEQDVEQIQTDIEGEWQGEDVSVSLQHENIFGATSEIDFSHARGRSPLAAGPG